MDFSLSNISWANLFENGHNFLSFSIMGMLIVFSGLTIISIYIVLLPKILNLPNLLTAKKEIKKKLLQAYEELANEKDSVLSTIVTSPFDRDILFYEENLVYKF